jgi:hypothetical protein
MRVSRDEYQEKYYFMVKSAADNKLDGYRELGERCAKLEEERDWWIKKHKEDLEGMVKQLHKAREDQQGTQQNPDNAAVKDFIVTSAIDSYLITKHALDVITRWRRDTSETDTFQSRCVSAEKTLFDLGRILGWEDKEVDHE